MCVAYRLQAVHTARVVWFVCFANLGQFVLLEAAAATWCDSTLRRVAIDTFLLLFFFLFESIHCVILASAGKFPTMPSFIYLNSIKRHLSELKCSEHSLSKGLRSFMCLVSRSSQGGPPALVKLKVNISSVFVTF